ncbi:hypothetical protein M758_8G057000 [Ceratodon purpureus]|nr:hypothetical protein M758_8G057000 [Ceratodon purpureus]
MIPKIKPTGYATNATPRPSSCLRLHATRLHLRISTCPPPASTQSRFSSTNQSEQLNSLPQRQKFPNPITAILSTPPQKITSNPSKPKTNFQSFPPPRTLRP